MKLLYSQIKEYVPKLKADPRRVGEVLTYAGYLMDSLEEVDYRGKKDHLIGLEVRQNRADCLSVIGLAREAAACRGLKAVLPKYPEIAGTGPALDIGVEAGKNIKRILAIQLDGVKNTASPAWLKQFLSFYDINSVNLLVDLSNYVMLVTGQPSHLIDMGKVTGQIRWAFNKDFSKMVTLDGTETALSKDQELVIRDDKNILALAGLVGGQAAAIDLKTTSLVAEMAIYDRSLVRRNSRSLKVVTEASHRLEKDLDPNGADYALQMLVSLLSKHGGQTASKVFEYYPKKYVSPQVDFDPALPGVFAGVTIPETKAINILKNLNFDVKKKGSHLLVTPPTYRQDVKLTEDVVEEVVRLYGYDKIPTDEIPELKVVEDITPEHIVLAEKTRDILAALGFDEILSWPLIEKGSNVSVNHLDWKVITAQNSVNENYPDLRQSMAAGLLGQLKEYLKKNIGLIQIFEIGKVFGLKGGRHLEHESVGILMHTPKKKMICFQKKVEGLLRQIGFADMEYQKSKLKLPAAHPDSCWDVLADKQPLGIIYKLKPLADGHTYFAEFDLTQASELLSKIHRQTAVELLQKLVVLDGNIEVKKGQSPNERLNQIKQKINKQNLWSIDVADQFALKDETRYTVRISYLGLSDQEAKQMHAQAFNLKKAV